MIKETQQKWDLTIGAQLIMSKAETKMTPSFLAGRAATLRSLSDYKTPISHPD